MIVMINRCLYPGSFDPFTNAHLDIVKRASRLFAEVFVVVLNNPNKRHRFSLEKRLEMVNSAVSEFTNVKTLASHGSLLEIIEKLRPVVLVRGLRDTSDLTYEFRFYETIRTLCPEVEVLYMLAKAEYRHVSSSGVKELIAYDLPVDRFVPGTVLPLITEHH